MISPTLVFVLVFGVIDQVYSSLPCVFRMTQSADTCPHAYNLEAALRHRNISKECLQNHIIFRNDGARFLYYERSKFSDKSFPVVKNLNEILSHVSEQSCFAMLDNFAGVNLFPLTHPVALRRLELSRHCTRSGVAIARIDCFWIWIPAGMIPPCSFYLTAEPKSKFSPKFIQHEFLDEVPYKINRTAFVTLTKQWNCQMNIQMYPPDYLVSGLDNKDILVPEIFHFDLRGYSLHVSMPYFIATSNFIIFRARQLTPHKHHNFLKLLSRNMIFNPISYITEARTFLYSMVNNPIYHIHFNFDGGLEDVVVTVESFWVIKTWSRNVEFLDTTTILVNNLATLRTLATLSATAFSMQEYYAQWEIIDWTKNLGYLERQLKSCNINPPKDREWSISEDLLQDAILRVWSTILMNFTNVVKREQKICLSGLTPVQSQNLVLQNLLLLRVQTSVNNTQQDDNMLTTQIKSATIRFVTCGERGLEEIGFQELIGFYGWLVWLLVTISILGVAFIVNITNYIKADGGGYRLKKSKLIAYINDVVATAQILLEQDGPSSPESDGALATRWARGPFLLMTIILITGYKNDNLYNVALPRQPVPYTRMKDLKQDNFSIYAKTGIFFMGFTPSYGIAS